MGGDALVSRGRAAGEAAACGAVVCLGLDVFATIFEGYLTTHFGEAPGLKVRPGARHPVLG